MSLVDSYNNSLSDSISNVSSTEAKTNLIVNYLPQTMVNDEFKSLFESIGPLESYKLIKDKTTNLNLGYGFVNYVNIEDAERAINSLNGIKLENKMIKVSYARPSSDSIKGANLYISGLPRNWDVSQLNNHFSCCGKIITSRILANPQNSMSKGVGFIRFDHKNEADLAINRFNGKIPENSSEPLIVKFANYSTILKSKLSSQSIAVQGHNNSINVPVINQFAQAPIPNGNFRLTSPQVFQAANQFPFFNNNDLIYGDTASQKQFNNLKPISTVGWCIFIYNLGPDAEESLLWKLFGPFGAVQNVKLIRNYMNQKCKGYGFVTMTNYEDALNAINSLNGLAYGNRILQVSFKIN